MSLDVTLYFPVDTGLEEPEWNAVFEANYTHNCAKMAAEADIYDCIWRPDECTYINRARDLIPLLAKGIALMESDPSRFEALNPENGWGSYETFLPWLKAYYKAAVQYPKASIHACR